jgi:adenylate kinase
LKKSVPSRPSRPPRATFAGEFFSAKTFSKNLFTLSGNLPPSALFSSRGLTAKAKVLWLGPPCFPSENHASELRSLNIEHVSPAILMRRKISRRESVSADASVGPAPTDKTIVASMRRWFFARKPDAGFALCGFPATLLQAKLLDEWLDARDENLDAVIAPATADASLAQVVGHYRTLGLLEETGENFVHA